MQIYISCLQRYQRCIVQCDFSGCNFLAHCALRKYIKHKFFLPRTSKCVVAFSKSKQSPQR